MAMHAVIKQTTFHVGDTVRVHYKIIEKEKIAGKTKRAVKEERKERVQVFEGIVISIKGQGNGKSFTVRRIGTAGIGVERIFPILSPWIAKITVKKYGDVRRSKLYYLREYKGKDAIQIKEKKKTKKTNEASKPAKRKVRRTSRRKTS